jgi:tetratricopeptide (TPR) repeat protein
MTLISIDEIENPALAQGEQQTAFQATVSFDHGPKYNITITDPFEEAQEKLLQWYFEEHLRHPFTDQVTAADVARSITAYGEALFKQVFPESALRAYARALAKGPAALSFAISGSPDFHRLHWEALKDPELPRPFALEAPVVRKNLEPPTLEAELSPSPTLNILVVTARPDGKNDIAYRTISRPLVEALAQSKVRVRIEILRPGSYKALVGELERKRDQFGAGYYHIIHFDTHGALLDFDQVEQVTDAGGSYTYQTRYGREDIEKYEGKKAFLVLEGETPEDELVEAQELADLLTSHGVPVAVLNACQSSMQEGASETSLASYLMRAGVQVALGMRYSVTVSAAELLMKTLYERLFAGDELSVALRRGRLEMSHQKGRKVYYDQTLDLEDWLLPVAYQNRPVQVQTREFTPAEAQAYYAAQAEKFPFPEPQYGFFGRDLDVLEIEKRLLRVENDKRRNLLLVRGLGGAGKTTLLRHLAAWWQTTHFVEQVFYFGYDEKAHTAQQIIHTLARGLLGEAHYQATFVPLDPKAGQQKLVEKLRGENHLLILDNLESVTGSSLAVPNTLPADEQKKLKRFLAELAGGKTVVLLGSRGGEDWLKEKAQNEAAALHEDDSYELQGLDEQAASALSERILSYHKIKTARQDSDLQTLFKLLGGFPLALEVVLPNLKAHTPKEVLDSLRQGDPALDAEKDTAKPLELAKTESIVKCIEYSHSNLSAEAQELMACLAPFTGVIDTRFLPQYTEQLKAQPAMAALHFERWQEVMQEAADWGLLAPHPAGGPFLRLQPILPYFLRQRLAQKGMEGVRQAVEAAFRQHYDGLGGAMYNLCQSKDAQEKQLGLFLVKLEYENLHTALFLALGAQVSILNLYAPLKLYLDAAQDQRGGLRLGEAVFEQLQTCPADVLSGQLGAEFVAVLDDIARRQLLLKQYTLAVAAYQKALEIWLSNQSSPPELIKQGSANIYHQLGRVAEEQRQWTQAEGYYQQALGIFIEFNDRNGQASTYHQLGMVAQEQRQWAQAEGNYQQALGIKIEFNDRYGQASTYHQLGIMAWEQRQWREAQAYYQQALAIMIEFNDRYGQAKTYHQLGRVAQEQRQWREAQAYYQQALGIYIEFNDRYGQASTYHQLGMVAQEQRQWAQAEKYYQQALAIMIEFNDRYAQASTYHQLGRVAQEQRQWAQAKQYFLTALVIYAPDPQENNFAIVFGSLARLWQESQDETLPAAVAGVLEVTEAEARELLKKAGD